MPGLLDIPSELLFEIIKIVASSPYPTNPDRKRYRPARLQSRAVVCFPTTEPSWPSHTRNLLLVCKKLYSEARTYISKEPQVFHLDIAIVNNHWIWPTWRYIPGAKLGYFLESLHINLIDCCTEDDRASFNTNSSNWDTPLELLKVISHFLRCGPTSAEFEGTRMLKGRYNFRIKTLVISIDTASIKCGNAKLSEYDVPIRQVQGLAHLNFDPLYSVDITTCLDHLDWLASFMNMAMHRELGFVTIRERVDRIVFSSHGRVRNEMNIAKYISEKQDARIAEYKRSELGGPPT
jgi:hypothetical protein